MQLLHCDQFSKYPNSQRYILVCVFVSDGATDGVLTWAAASFGVRLTGFVARVRTRSSSHTSASAAA